MALSLPNELTLKILGSFAQFNQETWRCKLYHGFIYTQDEIENRHTLMACSCVCRKWRQLAVPCLLRTLSLRFSPVETDQRDTTRTLHPHRTPTSFLSLIESHPALRHSLEELRLTFDDDEENHRYPCDTTIFARILDQLPQLRVLQLVNLGFSRGDLSAAGPPRRLKRLDIFTALSGYRRRPVNDPSPLLCLFDYIGTLRLENQYSPSEDNTPNNVLIPPLHVESLVLLGAECVEAAGFALPSLLAALVKPVTYLELAADMTDDGFHALNRLWNQLSPHLDSVVLIFSEMFYPPSSPSTLIFARIFDLSRCTRVKSVVLVFNVFDRYHWQALHDMLCCLHNSRSLRQLTVRPSFRWNLSCSLSDVHCMVPLDFIQNVGTELLKLKRAKRVDVNITLSGRGAQDSFRPDFDEEITISEDDMMLSLFPQLVGVE